MSPRPPAQKDDRSTTIPRLVIPHRLDPSLPIGRPPPSAFSPSSDESPFRRSLQSYTFAPMISRPFTTRPPLPGPAASTWWRTGPQAAFPEPDTPLPSLKPWLYASPARPLPVVDRPTSQAIAPIRATPARLVSPTAGPQVEGGRSRALLSTTLAHLPVSASGMSGRHPTACDTCKKRKEKCDRGRPCQRCSDRGVEDQCTYLRVEQTIEQKRRRVETHSSEQSLSPSPLSTPIYVLSPTDAPGPSRRSSRSPGPRRPDRRGRQPAHTARDLASFYAPIPSIHPVSNERSVSIGAVVITTTTTTTPSRRPSLDVVGRNASFRAGNVGEGRSMIPVDELMEEDEVAGIGSRRRTDDGQDIEGEKLFFGTSHFGPQLAAKVIKGSASVPLTNVRSSVARGVSIVDDSKAYTLASQVRELLRLLPRKERCDAYVKAFFEHYNDHTDVIYEPEFMRKYSTFWNTSNEQTQAQHIDLRQMALLFIVLAFGVLLDVSSRSSSASPVDDQVAPKVALEQTEREETSLTWSWAAKRALSEAGRFHGESMDTVRSGTMIALYLIICRRVPEAWTAVGDAIRAAYAQGMHIDGSFWSTMPAAEAELRRRLWAQIYALDRSISFFLGRPSGIQAEFTTREPSNITDDELSWSKLSAVPRPIASLTKSTFLILHLRLAKIIDHTQTRCFGLRPRTYDDVLECEAKFAAFAASLPPAFRLDTRKGDDGTPDSQTDPRWLSPQRATLTSKFHLARISLHRPYLLRSFREGGAYAPSLEACVSSAVEEIVLRTRAEVYDPLHRFKWMTVASGFNPAAIIGIICALRLKNDKFDRGSLLSLLRDYIAAEERTVRKDETLEAELVVLRMMLDMGRGGRDASRSRDQAYVASRAEVAPGPTPSAAGLGGEKGSPPTISGAGSSLSLFDDPFLAHADEWLAPPSWKTTSDQFPGDAEAWLRMFAEGAERDLSGGFGLGALMLGDEWKESPSSVGEPMPGG